MIDLMVGRIAGQARTRWFGSSPGTAQQTAKMISSAGLIGLQSHVQIANDQRRASARELPSLQFNPIPVFAAQSDLLPSHHGTRTPTIRGPLALPNFNS